MTQFTVISNKDLKKLIALVGAADWDTIMRGESQFESQYKANRLLLEICRIVRPDLMEGEDEEAKKSARY